MQNHKIIYAFMVFFASGCYGATASIIKIAFMTGLTWTQITFAAGFFGMLIFGAFSLVSKKKITHNSAFDAREALRLVLLGVLSCAMEMMYALALSRVNVSIAMTMLFQFVWMGLLLELVISKRGPRFIEIISIVVVLVGTYFGSGFAELGADAFKGQLFLGVAAALGAAATYTAFLHFNGKTGTDIHWAVRGFFICLGFAIAALPFGGSFFASSALFKGGLWCGLALGFVGQLIPVALLGVAVPHLETSLVTIMAAGELPCGIFVAFVILREPVTALVLLGVGLVLAGIVLAELPNLFKTAKARMP